VTTWNCPTTVSTLLTPYLGSLLVAAKGWLLMLVIFGMPVAGSA
jgi:hypothetical protein